MAKVLVTGANGFIGQNLVARLVARGDDVTCLVRKTAVLDALKPFDVRLAYGDVTSQETVAAALDGAETVYHVAGAVRALDPAELYRVNEAGTAAVADACAARNSPPVLLYVSSLAAAGPSEFDRPHLEPDPAQPVSEYGKSKLAGERQLQRRAGRLPISIVRPPIVFGPGGRDMLAMFKSVKLGLHFVPGLVPQRFSLVEVADLVDAMILAAERGRRLHGPDDETAQGLYYATMPEAPTYDDLGRLIANALGRCRVLTIPTPHALGWVLAGVNAVRAQVTRCPLLLNADKMREATAGSWTCNGRRAAGELGFTPPQTLLKRLTQSAQWYREHGWL